jgi:hypothetical protein
MSARKIVLDVTNLGPQPSSACPACGAALSSVDSKTLRPLTINLFRCPPGRHPRAFEGRCGACGRFLILLKGEHGLVLVHGNQDDLLHSIRSSEREHATLRKGRADER